MSRLACKSLQSCLCVRCIDLRAVMFDAECWRVMLCRTKTRHYPSRLRSTQLKLLPKLYGHTWDSACAWMQQRARQCLVVILRPPWYTRCHAQIHASPWRSAACPAPPNTGDVIAGQSFFKLLLLSTSFPSPPP